MRSFIHGMFFGMILKMAFECSSEGHTEHCLIFMCIGILICLLNYYANKMEKKNVKKVK